MRSRYKAISDNSYYFITSSVVEWVPIFNEATYRNILIEALGYRIDNKTIKLYAYVIMPDHFHAIISTNDITKALKEYKSYTARLIVDKLKDEKRIDLLEIFKQNKKEHKTDSVYQIWQEGFHPQLLVGDEMFHQKAEYIHNNPIRAGLIEKAEDWIYSSAPNYLLGTGIIPIDKIM